MGGRRGHQLGIGTIVSHPGGHTIGEEDLATERIGHCSRTAAQRHVDGHKHVADGVVERAAQGIHQPLARGPCGTLLSAFFAKYTVIGPGSVDDVEDHLLGIDIGCGGEVPGTLLSAGEPLAVQVAHYVRAGTCRNYRDPNIVKARI